MTEDSWLGSIADITASVADEHDIPLSIFEAGGLVTEKGRHVGLDESQNLRLLRVSVAELQRGVITVEQYEDNVLRISDVAYKSWSALQALPEEYGFQDLATTLFEDLYDACQRMLDEPVRGLGEAVRAYRAIDHLERELKEVNDQAA